MRTHRYDPSSTAVAISHDAAARYPDSSEYGPASDFVEIAARAGPYAASAPYALVREALLAAGCDTSRAGTAAWNPLGDFIRSGERVHVLPNFVMQRRGFEHDEHTFFGKVTHASVLQPVLDYAIKAAGDAKLVSVGNAPVQGCNFDNIKREVGLEQLVSAYFAPRGEAPSVVDLRGLRTTFTSSGALLSREETGEEYVAIDLGADSLLERLYEGGQEPQFRVGDYPGSATASFHGRGRHIYVLNKRVLDARAIVSVPKLKTHEKVGITCALKGTVGSIARKECLAHHRLGGKRSGGDEHARDWLAARMTSRLLEYVSDLPVGPYSNALRVVATTAFRAFRILAPGTMGGAWSGNDTAWRMALDIARVLRYATPDGVLAETPQREHIACVDGIVSGEGNGPLHQQARDTGAIIFGADPCLVDWVCALVMGYDPRRIHLLREAFMLERYPLTSNRTSELDARLNGRRVDEETLRRHFDPPHLPPVGWRSHLGYS